MAQPPRIVKLEEWTAYELPQGCRRNTTVRGQLEPAEAVAMNRLTELQVRRNRAAGDRWGEMAPHRQQVTARLLELAGPLFSRLCVLGAGNCNDLELPRLTAAYREVHLVDLDAEALATGAARQAADASRLHLHGGVDVTGVWDLLAGWSPQSPPDETEFERCLKLAAGPPWLPLPAPFDVVASTCLASQLIEAVALSLGAAHPRLLELLLAVRTAHMRRLVQLARAGGRGLLVADFVSSDTVPGLAAVSDSELPALVDQLLREGNFFHGLNPRVLDSLFRADPIIAPLVARAELAGPWRWQVGGRTYLVCAVAFERSSISPLDA